MNDENNKLFGSNFFDTNEDLYSEFLKSGDQGCYCNKFGEDAFFKPEQNYNKFFDLESRSNRSVKSNRSMSDIQLKPMFISNNNNNNYISKQNNELFTQIINQYDDSKKDNNNIPINFNAFMSPNIPANKPQNANKNKYTINNLENNNNNINNNKFLNKKRLISSDELQIENESVAKKSYFISDNINIVNNSNNNIINVKKNKNKKKINSNKLINNNNTENNNNIKIKENDKNEDSLDDKSDESEEKLDEKEIKLLKNRLSARKCRQKKKNYISQLEHQVEEYKSQIDNYNNENKNSNTLEGSLNKLNKLEGEIQNEENITKLESLKYEYILLQKKITKKLFISQIKLMMPLECKIFQNKFIKLEQFDENIDSIEEIKKKINANIKLLNELYEFDKNDSSFFSKKGKEATAYKLFIFYQNMLNYIDSSIHNFNISTK